MMSDMGLSEMYEAKIEDLELRNEKLQDQVIELRAELIQMLSAMSLIAKVIKATTAEEFLNDNAPEA
jgi:hypothetical protein